MILKIKTVGGWAFVSDVGSTEIKASGVKSGEHGYQFSGDQALYADKEYRRDRYFIDLPIEDKEILMTDGYYDCTQAEVFYTDGSVGRVIYNTQAYLLSDKGETIDRI